MEPTPMEAFPYGDWDPLSLLFTNEDLDLTQRAALGEGSPEVMYDRMSSGFPADYISAVPGGSLVDQTMPGICGNSLNPTLSPNCSSLGGNSQQGSYASGLSNSFREYYTEMPILMEERYSGDSFVPDFMGILTRECVRQNDDNNNNQDGEVPANQEASVPAANRLQPKRKCTRSKSCSGEENNADTEATQNPKKRKPRAREDKGKKEAQPRKKKKLAGDEGQGGNTIARQEGQSSSTYSSEEDCVSDELHNAESAQNSNETLALSSDGKTTRASRGTATDPQSLYARRRRERINERLKILQSLVPNGTKVDISTMLEEAVHYVKFLQLQIKLLSSDELWMYAPIAYNGMDIGLNQILSQLH